MLINFTEKVKQCMGQFQHVQFSSRKSRERLCNFQERGCSTKIEILDHSDELVKYCFLERPDRDMLNAWLLSKSQAMRVRKSRSKSRKKVEKKSKSRKIKNLPICLKHLKMIEKPHNIENWRSRKKSKKVEKRRMV
jgi:pyridoxine/pyridoxamine 5'-phosphate oxidase